MVIEHRTYSGKKFRPTPLVWTSDDQRLIIVCNSWGDSSHGQLVIDEISKYVNSALSDLEVTSPFEFLPQFSSEVNYLRIGMQIANEVLYRTINKQEYVAGVEVVALLKRNNSVSWAQVGHPNIYLSEPNVGIHALSVEPSMDSILPTRLLGLESGIYIQSGSVRFNDGDKIVLHSGGKLGFQFYNEVQNEISLANMTRSLGRSNVNEPFWIGLVNPQD